MTQEINVIAIDIGVKNLAICKIKTILIKSCEDTEEKSINKPIITIKYWEVINIFANTEYADKSCKNIPVEIISECLTRKFWEIMPILCNEKIDHVVMEKQMNTTEMAYYAYILQSLFYTCIRLENKLKYKIGSISFQNAKKKFELAKLLTLVDSEKIKNHDVTELNRMIDILADKINVRDRMAKDADYAGISLVATKNMNMPTMKEKKIRYTKTLNNYVFNKKLSTLITKMLLIHYGLEQNDIELQHVKNKKDDLCDAFNIGYYELVEQGYIKNHQYILNKKRKRKRS